MAEKNKASLILNLFSAALKDGAGNIKGGIVLLVDITQRKIIQQQLEDKNRELSDFTYVVSHDLKNPLNLISNYLGLISERPELLSTLIGKVQDQAKNMTDYIEKLLKLSRAGRIIGDKKLIDLNTFIRMIFLSLQNPSIPAELKFLVNLPEIMADPGSFENMFVNLLQNAMESRDPAKENLIIQVGCTSEDDTMVISIKDNGIGIESGYLEKIFHPGFTMHKAKGTGFGLAIARKIAESHQGNIWAESEGKGKGSTFYIRLPRSR